MSVSGNLFRFLGTSGMGPLTHALAHFHGLAHGAPLVGCISVIMGSYFPSLCVRNQYGKTIANAVEIDRLASNTAGRRCGAR